MLLKEMQEMDKFVQKPVPAPSVINEVASPQNQQWSGTNDESLAEVLALKYLFFCNVGNHMYLLLVLATIAES